MTQLNSSFLTALQRRYLPVVMTLILLAVFVAVLVASGPSFAGLAIATAVIAGVALAYFAVYRALIFPAADRVVLDGASLHVRRGRREVAVPVRNISNIRSITCMSPETVTLDLNEDCELGRSITFIPPARLPSGQEHPILAPLRAAMHV